MFRRPSADIPINKTIHYNSQPKKGKKEKTPIFTGMVRWGGEEGGEGFRLALEGGDPPSRAKPKAGADEGSVQLMDLAFIVFRMLNPSNLI